MIFKVGDLVRFGAPNGSIGRLIERNHYGGFYVEWIYGLDARGDLMRATGSVRGEQLMPATREEYDRIATREGFSR